MSKILAGLFIVAMSFGTAQASERHGHGHNHGHKHHGHHHHHGHVRHHHHSSFSFSFGFGRPRQVWIPGYYEVRTETYLVSPARIEKYWDGHVWVETNIPARYETRNVQVWIPGCWR